MQPCPLQYAHRQFPHQRLTVCRPFARDDKRSTSKSVIVIVFIIVLALASVSLRRRAIVIVSVNVNVEKMFLGLEQTAGFSF
jgi:hypothetical protein